MSNPSKSIGVQIQKEKSELKPSANSGGDSKEKLGHKSKRMKIPCPESSGFIWNDHVSKILGEDREAADCSLGIEGVFDNYNSNTASSLSISGLRFCSEDQELAQATRPPLSQRVLIDEPSFQFSETADIPQKDWDELFELACMTVQNAPCEFN